MYQIKMSLNKKQVHWLDRRFENLESRIRKLDGVVAKIERYGRIIVAIACENAHKPTVETYIRRYLTDLYVTTAKEEYFKGRIKFCSADEAGNRMLLHALAVFDRERDREYVKKRLTLSGDFSIDGFFMFKLGELKARWAEIGGMTEDNLALLYDEESLHLLLRFLLSAVNPKCETVTVFCETDQYRLKLGETPEILTAADATDLLLGLIDIAPIEVRIADSVRDRGLTGKIRSLFDVSEGSAPMGASFHRGLD